MTADCNAAIEGVLAAGATSVVEGLDSSFAAALFIGYHGRAGKNAVLSHSFMGKDFYEERLGNEIVTVPVKRSLDRFAAECMHPVAARAAIRHGAARSLAIRDRVTPIPLSPEYEVVLDLLAPTQAWICSCMPGVERTGDRQVTYIARDATRIFPFLMAAMIASRGVTDMVY